MIRFDDLSGSPNRRIITQSIGRTYTVDHLRLVELLKKWFQRWTGLTCNHLMKVHLSRGILAFTEVA